MREKVKLNEKDVCERYLKTNIGVESLACELHVGKKKIKEILLKNGVEIKKRGAQESKKTKIIDDWKTEKYPKVDGKHYVAVDRVSGFETKDYMNSAGVLTSFIRDNYLVKIPTLYDRRQYYCETGNYWWEQWFDIKLVENCEVKKCPYCDWETSDVMNRSGAFEVHLKKTHGIKKIDYISEHPEEKSYFSLVSRQKNRQMCDNSDEYVTCKICGTKLARVDSHHLKLHNITKEEYITKYGPCEMVSESYRKMSEEHIRKNNENMKFHKESSQEKEIKDFISTLGFNVVSDRKILRGLEIDIYIPELMVGFEYNGNLFHTEKYGKDRNYHLNKTVKCYENGVMLYHIFDDDFFYHKEILFSKIRHILGKDDGERLRAGKCKINEITKNESDIFLEKYHIQGSCNGSIYIGGFYKNELVAVMVFLNEGSGNWNLTRFATNHNYRIVGIGGKLFSYFRKNHSFETIKSFAERRLTPNIEKNLYTKLGFKLEDIGKPDYKYYSPKVDRYKRFHKFGFRKKILHKKYGLPLTMTEHEMTKALGFYRIWDCGLLKYVYRKSVD